MSRQYASAHVTIVPFDGSERCKPAPNSLIESLACGRPVVVTEEVGLAEVVREARCGSVCLRNGTSLAREIDVLRDNWQELSCRSREAAEREFGLNRFVEAYKSLYGEVM